MSFIVKPGQSNFQNAPQGMHQVVCCDVVDLGMVHSERFNKTQPKVKIVWQLGETMEDGRRYIVSKTFTVSLDDKSNLKPFLENWRGESFTTEELNAGFDLEKLYAVNGMAQILHKPRRDGNGTWADVTTILPLMKGLQKIAPDENYVRVKDRPPQEQQASSRPPQQQAAGANYGKQNAFQAASSVVINKEEDEIPF